MQRVASRQGRRVVSHCVCPPGDEVYRERRRERCRRGRSEDMANSSGDGPRPSNGRPKAFRGPSKSCQGSLRPSKGSRGLPRPQNFESLPAHIPWACSHGLPGLSVSLEGPFKTCPESWKDLGRPRETWKDPRRPWWGLLSSFQCLGASKVSPRLRGPMWDSPLGRISSSTLALPKAWRLGVASPALATWMCAAFDSGKSPPPPRRRRQEGGDRQPPASRNLQIEGLAARAVPSPRRGSLGAHFVLHGARGVSRYRWAFCSGESEASGFGGAPRWRSIDRRWPAADVASWRYRR